MPPVVLGRLGFTRRSVFHERRLLGATLMVFLSFCGACLTALLAQVRIPLPFTPVPLTGQVFAVLVCGALLGSGYGALSQMFYVGLGVVGVPWFAGGIGLAVFTGATAGYLIGFIVAAFFLGFITRRFAGARRLEGQIWAMLAAVGIIYLFGTLHLTLCLGWSPAVAVSEGVAPFVAGDLIKVVLAASVTSRLLRRPTSTERL